MKKGNVTAKKIWSAIGKQKAIAAIVLICCVMPFVNSAFLTRHNILDILKSSAVLAMIGCGLSFVIICGACDLSVGGTMCLSGIILVKLMPFLPLWLCCLISILAGGVVGFINGFLVVHQKTEAFVMTLGMGALLKGVGQILTNAHPIMGTNETFLKFGTGNVAGVPNIVLVMVLAVILTFIILRFTQFGRNCYAIGGDYKVAEYAGISAVRIKWMTFVLCGIFAALGGILLTARLNSAASTHGDTTALLVNCGAVLGGTSFAGGIGGSFQTFLGLVLFSVVDSAFGMSPLSAYTQHAITGVIIVLIIGLDSYSRKKKQKDV